MRELLGPLASARTWATPWEQRQPPCGLASCSRSRSLWRQLWRRQSGTFLDGTYYCRPQCLETALIDQFARFEALSPLPQPPHRIPLGLLMVARGRLSYEQVQTALAAQQSAQSGKIGEWFEKLGFATEQEVTAALGLQWGCPVAGSLNPGVVEPPGRIPLAILETFYMVPLQYLPATNTLYLAFGERVDHAALYTIERILDCRTQPCVAGRKGIASQLERMGQQPRPNEVEFGPLRDPVEMGRISASYVARVGAEDVRLGRLGPFIWLRLKARSSVLNLLFRLRAEPTKTRSAVLPATFASADLLQRALE